MLLLRENTEDNITFSSINATRYSPYDDKRYSILSTVYNDSNQLRIDGKFEFLIEYPGYHEGYNQWRQTNYLLEEKDSENNVTGFEEIHTDFQIVQNEKTLWKGLSLSSSYYTLLDGTKALYDWYFSFGAVHIIDNMYIPTHKYRGTKEELLWIRIPSISYLYLLTSTCKHHSNLSLGLINTIFLMS